MDVRLWVRDVNAFGIKAFFQRFVSREVFRSVIRAIHPGADDEVDAAIGELNDSDCCGWLIL